MTARARLMPLLAALALTPASAAAKAGPENGGTPAPSSGAVSTVSDGSFSLTARADALLGKIARFRGRVPEGAAGRTVTVERFDSRGRGWVPAGTATARRDGSFLARWRTDTIGRIRVRARLDGSGARAASASPEMTVTVYRPAVSTWYGPGFYGRRTACGRRMTKRLLGVAHRWLPCGTQVALMYKGRTLVVPVVDRGPFRRGTDWDLTAATARALGFEHTDRIGAVSLR